MTSCKEIHLLTKVLRQKIQSQETSRYKKYFFRTEAMFAPMMVSPDLGSLFWFFSWLPSRLCVLLFLKWKLSNKTWLSKTLHFSTNSRTHTHKHEGKQGELLFLQPKEGSLKKKNCKCFKYPNHNWDFLWYKIDGKKLKYGMAGYKKDWRDPITS